jgi:hypothetical protein
MRLWQRPTGGRLRGHAKSVRSFPEDEETTDRWSGVYADPAPDLPGALVPPRAKDALAASEAAKDALTASRRTGRPGEGADDGVAASNPV